ncbi:hypothetical protein [Micromonospora chokoriensis]|uniref:hypothetical protein n=1 Tax=Micromonospora chokoriensis TaxID=356851 RepID=UPI000A93261D|nr:hypothetical protein [Micromonospora chokoriensis]
MTSTTPSADEVRALPYQDTAQRAVAALTSGQETFTLTQVAYLTALAFQMGVATADGPSDDPALWNLAYQAGYINGNDDGEERTLAEVWEGLRYAFSGPRRKARDGVPGNLTAADALWWHNEAVKRRDARRAADRAVPRAGDFPGGSRGVDWETGRPVRELRVAA